MLASTPQITILHPKIVKTAPRNETSLSCVVALSPVVQLNRNGQGTARKVCVYGCAVRL